MTNSPKAYNLPFEAREVERVPVVLPALMLVEGIALPVRVVNITRNGAQVETAAPIARRCRVTLRCGLIDAEAVVIWVGSGQIGLRFLHKQSCSDVAKQIARYEAVRPRNQSGMSVQRSAGGDA